MSAAIGERELRLCPLDGQTVHEIDLQMVREYLKSRSALAYGLRGGW